MLVSYQAEACMDIVENPRNSRYLSEMRITVFGCLVRGLVRGLVRVPRFLGLMGW